MKKGPKQYLHGQANFLIRAFDFNKVKITDFKKSTKKETTKFLIAFLNDPEWGDDERSDDIKFLEDRSMPIVGQKEFFAIEWKFHSTSGSWIFAHFQYWGGGIPIGDWEDTVVLPDVIINHQLYANRIEKPDIQIDCSNFSSDYLLDALFDYINEDKHREEYSEFYRLACEAREIDEGNEYPKSSDGIVVYPGDGSLPYRFEFPPEEFNTDRGLADWMSGILDVSGMGNCAIDDHAVLYFVSNVSQNQERLIWKNIYRHLDDEGRTLDVAMSTRPFEVVMPVGYFKKTIREFVHVASDEITELKNEAKDFDYARFLESLVKKQELSPCPASDSPESQ